MGRPSSSLDLTGVSAPEFTPTMSLSFFGVEQPEWDAVLTMALTTFGPKTATAWDPRNECVLRYYHQGTIGDSPNHGMIRWNWDHTLSLDAMAELATYWIRLNLDITILYLRRQVRLQSPELGWSITLSILSDTVRCVATKPLGASKSFEADRRLWQQSSAQEPWVAEEVHRDSINDVEYHALLRQALVFLGHPME